VTPPVNKPETTSASRNHTRRTYRKKKHLRYLSTKHVVIHRRSASKNESWNEDNKDHVRGQVCPHRDRGTQEPQLAMGLQHSKNYTQHQKERCIRDELDALPQHTHQYSQEECEEEEEATMGGVKVPADIPHAAH
jgi:hypothetical protein